MKIVKEECDVKKIVNTKGLAEIVGRHRTRLHRLVVEGRLKPDYRDNEGIPYWNEKRAQEIAAMIKEQTETRKPGRGRPIILDRSHKE